MVYCQAMPLTQAQRVAAAALSGLLGSFFVVWMAPGVLLVAFVGAVVVLAYAALYLVVMAWLDPKGEGHKGDP